MGLLIAFSALFLILLAALAFASIRLFEAKDDKGNRTAPGCLGGCVTALALTIIGVLGLAAFIAGCLAISAGRTVSAVIESAPDMKVGIWHDRQLRTQSIEGHPIHIVLEWSGHSDPTEALLRKIEEAGAEGEMNVTVLYETNADGEPVTIVDIAIPMSEHDAEELEEALEQMRSDLSLSEGVEIILRKVERGELR